MWKKSKSAQLTGMFNARFFKGVMGGRDICMGQESESKNQEDDDP